MREHKVRYTESRLNVCTSIIPEEDEEGGNLTMKLIHEDPLNPFSSPDSRRGDDDDNPVITQRCDISKACPERISELTYEIIRLHRIIIGALRFIICPKCRYKAE